MADEIKDLRVEQNEDWWDELPKDIQTDIDRALADLDNDKGIPHELVMKITK